ncbi:MAG TPA: glycoside hydrolase family 43 protein [Capsulimonadaceae bacterium]|jgi:alpha-N-arabinofuranosidase
MTTYSNPILKGFRPDPSIIRVGNDYYLVVSSFEYFPGLPIYRSTNLVEWSQIGYVLNRTSQLDIVAPRPSSGLFAPTIRYHDGVFYVICTLMNNGGNFIVTAADPAGPWSDPIWIAGAEGIDPSLFFGDDGRCYYVGNGSPDEPLYDGHRTIWLQEITPRDGRLIGHKAVIVNGGTDITKKPIWIEGPHIYKREGRYILVAAEGGTGEQHSEVVFRTDENASIWGPYEPYSGNPIISNRDVTDSGENPITCTGHADLVETSDGELWAVLLGCRPYAPTFENWYNTGRETFLVPMAWRNGWPVTRDGSARVKHSYDLPSIAVPVELGGLQDANGYFDDFGSETLGHEWYAIGRSPEIDGWLDLSSQPGKLRIQPRVDCLGTLGNPAFIGYRQRDLAFEATARITLPEVAGPAQYGMAVQQNNTTFLAIMARITDGGLVVTVERKCPDELPEIIASAIIPNLTLDLRIAADGRDYNFAISTDGAHFKELASSIDGSILSTRYTGGFVGAMIGLYAVGEGDGNSAMGVDWFSYRPL